MALFSFRHSVKTFSDKRTDSSRAAVAGQTAAHLRYICRPKAARVVVTERLIGGNVLTASKAAERDAKKRKGRVCERFVVALPVEATEDERLELAKKFAECLSHGVAGYVIAIHDCNANDVKNPHAHFVFFDVHQKTGGRGRPKSILGLARKNAIERTAELWAELHNRMMIDWGYGPGSAITHLSFAEQGIERIPTIHEGAGGRALAGKPLRSKPEWRCIDGGHSRAEANAVIREINTLKEYVDGRSDQLGGADEGFRAERKRSFEEQRERSRWHGETFGANGPPFDQVGCSSERHPSTERGGKSPPKRRNEHPQIQPRRQPPFVAAAKSGLTRFIPKRGRIRRLFRELIMLRDYLARDIAASSPSSGAPQSKLSEPSDCSDQYTCLRKQKRLKRVL